MRFAQLALPLLAAGWTTAAIAQSNLEDVTPEKLLSDGFEVKAVVVFPDAKMPSIVMQKGKTVYVCGYEREKNQCIKWAEGN